MIGTQILRFLGVGGIATAIQYVILIVLVKAGVDAVVASTAGFAISAVFNYLLNRRYTFASDTAHARAAPRFAAVALVGLSCNAGFLALFHNIAGLHYLLAQVLATGASLGINFIFNRMWTFAPGKKSKTPS